MRCPRGRGPHRTRRTPRIRWIRGVRENQAYEALGSADISASEAAGLDAGLDAGVVETSDGVVDPAGVLQARTAPPREAARARASRIRLNMSEEFLRCTGAGDSGASVWAGGGHAAGPQPAQANGATAVTAAPATGRRRCFGRSADPAPLKLPLFDEPGNFFVVAAMVAFSIAILGAARWRHWI